MIPRASILGLAVFLLAVGDAVAAPNDDALCFPGAPVNRAEGVRSPPRSDIQRVLAARRETERLAADVHLRGGTWPPVQASAEHALQEATALFGAAACLVPFLEQAGAAAAGAGDLELAEKYYRQALALLPERPDVAFYRATVADNLARLLTRKGAAAAASADMQSQAHALLQQAQAAEPQRDLYAVLESWIGPTLLDEVYLGAATGALLLNRMGLVVGIYDQPFRYQLYALHAQDVLRVHDDAPERLKVVVKSSELDALGELAKAQDDRELLTQIAEAERALVASMRAGASRLEIDREHLRHVYMLRGLGRLAEIRQTINEVAPELLAADTRLAAEVYLTRAELMMMEGNGEGAAAELKRAEGAASGPPPAQGREPFALQHAIEALLAHNPELARQHLVAQNGVQEPRANRLLADIAIRQGKAGDAVQAIERAIAATEAQTSNSADEGPLSYGAAVISRELSLSVDQAVTLTLAAPQDRALAEFAAQAVLRTRGHLLARSAAELRRLNLLPMGAETMLVSLRSARARLAGELREIETNPDVAPNWPVLDAILQKEQELQGEFAKQSIGKPPPRPDVNLAAMLDGLGGRAALVIYAVYRPFNPTADALGLDTGAEPRMAAALLQKDRPPRWADLGPAGAFDDAARRLRALIAYNRVPASQADAASKGVPLETFKEVDEKTSLLLGPWRTELAGLKRVTFAPDGSASLLPFPALLSFGAAADAPAVSLITTAADLANAPGTPAANRPVIFSSPDFDASSVALPTAVPGLPPAQPRPNPNPFPALPGAAAEAGRLLQTMPDAQLFANDKASKAALLGVHRPLVLHLATHAGFRPPAPPSVGRIASASSNPMLTSYLAFAGANSPAIGSEAPATALDVSSLDLDGTELVVLSACETGLGGVTPGEGVFGLRRAFIAAGARRLVMSLWKVDDDATAFLMGAFYAAIKQGLDVDLALARAQKQTREHKEWADPYFWSGFLLSGAPGRFDLALAAAPASAAASTGLPAAREPHPLAGIVAWNAETGGKIQASPMASAKVVIVGTEEGTLHALDRLSGRDAWPAFLANGRLVGQAEIADGKVFVGSEAGIVYALDEASGKKIWERKVEGGISAALAVDKGVVYVPARGLSALDAANGQVLWTYKPEAGPASPATTSLAGFAARPVLDQEFVYVGDLGGRFHRLSRADGRPSWQFALGSASVATAMLSDDLVVTATHGGSVIGIDRASGKQSWRFEAHNEIDTQVLLSDGKVIFAANGSPTLTALDVHSGKQAWQVQAPTQLIWSIVLNGPQLLLGASDGLWLLDRASGQTRRLLAEDVAGAPFLLDDMAYVSTRDGAVHAVK